MIELAHQREEVDDEVCISAQCEEGSAAQVLVGLKHLTVLCVDMQLYAVKHAVVCVWTLLHMWTCSCMQ